MKRPIISVLFVLLICAVAAGFYRGWFTLSSHSPDAGNNKVDINLTVDPDKMKEDAEMLKGKTAELTGHGKDEVHEVDNEK